MKTSKLSKAWETASDQIVIGFGFASYWLKERREFSEPITERRARKGCTHNQRETNPIKVQSGESYPWVKKAFSSLYFIAWGYAVVTAKHLVLCLFLENCSASDHDLRGERQVLQWPTPLLIRKSLTPLYHLPLWSASGIWPVALSTLQVCGNQTRWLVWLWWLPLRRDDNILAATEGAANKVNHYKKKKRTNALTGRWTRTDYSVPVSSTGTSDGMLA